MLAYVCDKMLTLYNKRCQDDAMSLEVKLNMENLKIEYQHRSQFDGAECAPGWVCNGGVHCFHASADFGGKKYAVQMPFSDDVSFKEMLSYVGLSLDRLLKRKREMAGIN
jgi:hypothetical protein